MVAEFAKERVSSRVGGTEVRAGSVGEGLGVDVVFIDGEYEVFGPIFCADRKSAGKVRENSVTSEVGRMHDLASEVNVGSFFRGVVF